MLVDADTGKTMIVGVMTRDKEYCERNKDVLDRYVYIPLTRRSNFGEALTSLIYLIYLILVHLIEMK